VREFTSLILDDRRKARELVGNRDQLHQQHELPKAGSKNQLHYLLRCQCVTELSQPVRETIARIDGSIVLDDATARAGRVARGQSGTLRVGFTENASWHGVVPDSFRRFRDHQPDAELQLNPLTTLEQIESVRLGRLDAGFVFNMPKADRELDQLPVAMQHVELAVVKGHRLSRSKKLRLRDLVDAPFVWFPRRESPAFYDRLMQECFRGGLKSPRIVQEAVNEATILSLVSQGMGVGWVNGTARWRCPNRPGFQTRRDWSGRSASNG
jgi:DNA-binding transcriptional LysR family regulator